ncbi:MAG: reverse transcriptase domain-containing protein [bacterium]|nr:reverse transcriptase domain-containing protein [bacterium]
MQKGFDKKVLSIIKQWLKAPVIKVEEGRKTNIGGGKKNGKGTPQGGVISPLLANIYLNILDRIWDRNGLIEKYNARLVRYADDMVILCKRDTQAVYAILQRVLGKLDLKLNEDKTQIKDSRKESFDFLGFSVRIATGKQSGKDFPLIEPSAKALKSIKEEIKFKDRRELNPMAIDAIVNNLNQTVRGWSQYFHYGYGHRKLKKVKYYMEESVRRHLRYKHKLVNRGRAYQQFPRSFIYDYLGLYKVPTTPVWKGVHA